MADLAELFSSLIGNYLALNISRIRVPGTPHTLISRVDSLSETPVSQFVKTGAQRGAISGHLLKFLKKFQQVKMSTRGRKKQTAATRVPPMAAESDDVTVPETVEPVSPVKRATRSRVAGSSSKTGTKTVPEQKLKKVPANPKVKKRVPVKKKPVPTDDDEFEDLTDPEVDFEELPVGIESELESNSEVERLRQRLAELEKVPRNPQFQADVESTDRHKSDSQQKRSKPSEGKILGTYDGKADLDSFLVRLECCSQHLSWSDADKKFHLINSLTGTCEFHCERSWSRWNSRTNCGTPANSIWKSSETS